MIKRRHKKCIKSTEKSIINESVPGYVTFDEKVSQVFNYKFTYDKRNETCYNHTASCYVEDVDEVN